MENIKEFIELKLKYESITKSDIKMWSPGTPPHNLNDLTGFGDTWTCSLCQAIPHLCEGCVWCDVTGSPCNKNHNEASYQEIYEAQSTIQLLDALQSRIARMNEVLDQIYWTYGSERQVLMGPYNQICKKIDKKKLGYRIFKLDVNKYESKINIDAQLGINK